MDLKIHRLKDVVKYILGSLFSNLKGREYIYRKCHEALIEQRKLREKMDNRTAGKLKVVHIETRTLCNGRCFFCPVAVQNNTRPDIFMEQALYKKIIIDLKNMDFDQRISPYCNNEPLLDDRIIDFISFARVSCEKATLELKTNGVLLSYKKMKQLSDAGLDRLYINDYHINRKLSAKLVELCSNYPKVGQTSIIYCNRKFDDNSGKNNRGGDNQIIIPLTRPLNVCCYRPFEMLTITADGSVSTCSNDVMFNNSIGNVNESSLGELWQCDAINRIRADLLQHRRYVGRTCSKCDYRGLDIGHEYRSLFRHILPLIIWGE
jgi:radical SAM protein with 4Fe4S-binding SPASM domain